MSGAADIEDRAARWLIRREEANWSPAEQIALDAWLQESMAHKVVFWRLEEGWRRADRIGALPIDEGTSDRVGPFYLRSPWWARGAIAASLLAFVGLATGPYEFFPRKPAAIANATYDTPVGGRRIVPLSDGSRIELNTNTELRAVVTRRKREIWLDKGEAYFEVAHINNMPFVVHAGSRTITVLGTKFSVRRDGEKVTVSVVQGRVRVDGAEARVIPAAVITAGDVAIGRGASTLLTPRSEERVEHALAWRDGMLTFDQLTLGEAAAEFNRYNIKRIEITDPETANIRIGGTFQASNVDAFVRLLADAYGLKVTADAQTIKISD